MFGLAKILAFSVIHKIGVARYLPDLRTGRLLEASLVTAINLPQELMELHKERMKAALDPRKKTVAFCLTTRAYRGNLGNIIEKLRKKGTYNVITVIGEMSGDDYERQRDVFYLPNNVYDAWSYLDFADVCVTVRPFDTSKPAGKLVYFLHDVHDSAIGDIEDNFRIVLDLDYFFLASRFILERVKRQVSIGKEKYLAGEAKNKGICVIGGGYPRLDRNLEYFEKHKQTSKTLIFATTAIEGPDTEGLIAIPGHAERVIDGILSAFPDYDLIFRPHPLTTHRPEVKNLVKKFEGHPRFTYDGNAASYMENYSKSALMITDASGTAYTYAFTTLRPVVFFSPNEPEVKRRFGTYQYFIDRNKVGCVAENVDEMIEKIKLLLGTKDDFSQKIREYRDSTIYNIGKSEDYFVDNFEYIIEGKKHPDWEYV